MDGKTLTHAQKKIHTRESQYKQAYFYYIPLQLPYITIVVIIEMQYLKRLPYGKK